MESREGGPQLVTSQGSRSARPGRALAARPPRKLLLPGTILAVGVLTNHVYRQPMDFRVYHFGARGVFDGTRPVYGLTSGLGWPMHYRYPPLFLLLFGPFTLLPLGPAAAAWVILKVLLLVWLVRRIWTA